jgi:hypothetical protein
LLVNEALPGAHFEPSLSRDSRRDSRVCQKRVACEHLIAGTALARRVHFVDSLVMGLKLRSVSLNLPFGLGGVIVDVSEPDVRAAWHLYVEFATRVTAHPLTPGAGSVSEALASLYSLFETSRQVLREAGPEVAEGPKSLGPLAIRILNEGIRPFLVRWHSEVRTAESSGGGLDERRRAEFDQELGQLRADLSQYVDALAEIAGIRMR